MAKRDAFRRHSNRHTVRQAANDRAPPVIPGGEQAQFSTAMNDNRTLESLPACLPVTDEEVRLLHQYLGAEILGLFA